MCGITGWIDRQASALGAEGIRRMNDAISHRGPDDDGIFITNTSSQRYNVALAYRRLAIIDLATGQQPFQTEDKNLTMVFNGEIYNFQALRDELRSLGHTFHTTSDTEVLLHAYRAWGPDCLRRLRGMFAFAIWDAQREQLFMARDRFGKKPLFIWQENDRILFGSEIKSLLLHPALKTGLDRQSVLDFLQYRYVPGPHTMFKNISKLPPGNYAIWQKGALTTQNYYLPPDGELPASLSETEKQDPVSAFTAALDESVRLRMIADVPFGAFLSGGIDSSAVVALMGRHSYLPVNTFSIGFKEAPYSEISYARKVSRMFKTNHHEWLMSADDIFTMLPKSISYRDAPLSEPTDIAMYVLSMEAAKSVKMVLTGEGADEILAGYPKHRFEPYAHAYQAVMPACIHNRLIEPLIDSLPYSFHRIQTLVRSLGLRCDKERMPRWFGSLSLQEADRLSALNVERRSPDMRPFTTPGDVSPLRRILYFDQTSWLPDNLLERGDRMTMAASIEARMPFMDHKLIDLVARFPDNYHIRNGQQKWLLRQAMASILPEKILTRTKVGFRVPVNLWFRTTLKEFIYDHLLGPNSYTHNFYRHDALTEMLDEHIDGQHNHEKLIWSLLNLELFQKQYKLA